MRRALLLGDAGKGAPGRTGGKSWGDEDEEDGGDEGDDEGEEAEEGGAGRAGDGQAKGKAGTSGRTAAAAAGAAPGKAVRPAQAGRRGGDVDMEVSHPQGACVGGGGGVERGPAAPRGLWHWPRPRPFGAIANRCEPELLHRVAQAGVLMGWVRQPAPSRSACAWGVGVAWGGSGGSGGAGGRAVA